MEYLFTAPAAEPVTLDEAKRHLQCEHDADNALIGTCIAAARQYAEEHCWSGFVTQTWELVLPCFPPTFTDYSKDGIELPRGKLASITSIKYIDGNGVEQTLATSQYVTDAVSKPGKARLAYGKSWPGARAQWDAVRVRYKVGWEAADVPAPIKQAILLLVGQCYYHRTPEITGTIVSEIRFTFDSLLSPYRLNKF